MAGDSVRGLLPRSWLGVSVWAVMAAVFVTHPIESTTTVFSAVRGAGAWASYHAFADCGDIPPFDWIDPKTCAGVEGRSVDASGHTGAAPTSAGPSPTRPAGGESGRYEVSLDHTVVETGLNAAVEVVLAVHRQVVKAAEADGISVHIGGEQP